MAKSVFRKPEKAGGVGNLKIQCGKTPVTKATVAEDCGNILLLLMQVVVELQTFGMILARNQGRRENDYSVQFMWMRLDVVDKWEVLK